MNMGVLNFLACALMIRYLTAACGGIGLPESVQFG